MRTPIAALAAVALAAPAFAQTAPAPLHVELKNNAGASVGHAMISEAPNGVVMRVEAKGLPPGWHGLHFHEKADCSKSDFTSAGGHVHDQPTMVHGLLNPDANEAGDLPNLFVAKDGTANAEFFSSYVSVKAAGRVRLADADGSALVIHASPDDHKTQPIGGAGARIACGAIK
ncbi:superoxide dismutase family protein [Phenylobacterium sp.]|jgi:Cu-Zn family superoxide dismutase|uniref:superoxide dismutase family protein n=1 Tax=Phenylobacterium sp. TaxID=1871053 RepID=UPI002E31CDFA|nr:superoxide dismutase family protein [Phenylobacterium sp.]HEX2560977.1 superoxide dismutase family protein [Phenylobacterium sp.]